jgi:hypothetical protein
MRFYVLPKQGEKTTYINFNHVSRISVEGPNIEIFLAGVEEPLVLPKNANTFAAIGKGMDLSDAAKEHLNAL